MRGRRLKLTQTKANSAVKQAAEKRDLSWTVLRPRSVAIDHRTLWHSFIFRSSAHSRDRDTDGVGGERE
jgi:hypothetical protein